MKIGYFCLVALGALLLVGTSNAQTLYSNGPVNGALPGSPGPGDAWLVNEGASVTDSFTLTGPGTASAFDFTAWNYPGDDTLDSVTWALGTTPFGTDVDSGTAIGGLGGNISGVLDSGSNENNYGYDINTFTVTGLDDPLSAATTYWLTLSAVDVDSGDPVYWDENDGPSLASISSGGTYSLAVPGPINQACANGAATCTGSETFDIYGSSNGTPEPGTLGLFGCGLLAMAGMIRRKMRTP